MPFLTRIRARVLMAALPVVLAGCASTGLSDAERLALYRSHAAAPQSSFRLSGTSLSGWTALGDSAVAVWVRPNEAYLLELVGPCQDLGFTPVIGLTSQVGQVSARFDRVLVRSTSPVASMPCPIQVIRRLDVKALRAEERTLREVRVEEGPRDARPVLDGGSQSQSQS